jgi:hypothetical protein
MDIAIDAVRIRALVAAKMPLAIESWATPIWLIRQEIKNPAFAGCRSSNPEKTVD